MYLRQASNVIKRLFSTRDPAYSRTRDMNILPNVQDVVVIFLYNGHFFKTGDLGADIPDLGVLPKPKVAAS